LLLCRFAALPLCRFLRFSLLIGTPLEGTVKVSANSHPPRLSHGLTGIAATSASHIRHIHIWILYLSISASPQHSYLKISPPAIAHRSERERQAEQVLYSRSDMRTGFNDDGPGVVREWLH
jgi:hypothetical protein